MEFLDLRKLLKRWWIIALAMIIGLLAAVVFAKSQSTTYLGKARLLVGPGISNTQPDLNVLRASGQLIQTYAEIPLTEPFLQSVLDELQLKMSTAQLAKMIEIRPNPETQILTIQVTSSNAEQAKTIAGLIAEKLVQMSPSNPESSAALLRGQVATHVNEMEQSIAETRQSIDLLKNDYRKALNQELLAAGKDLSTQSVARQLNEFEQNADLIASADTQSVAGVNILEKLIGYTELRITWFGTELKPETNPITRKIILEELQADRVHLSNLQQGIVELKRPIEGLPLAEFIATNQEQIQALEKSLDNNLNFDFRRLQLDRITLGQNKLNKALALEASRQDLILARISEERDRIYKVDLLDLENQQAILKELEIEQGQLSNLQNTLSVLYSSVQAANPNRVEIIERAEPTATDAPLSLMGLIGALAGATLGLIGVLAFDLISDTIESSDQIVNVGRAPIIEVGESHSRMYNLLHRNQVRNERWQQYQMVGMRLLYDDDDDNKMVLISPIDDHSAGVLAVQVAQFLVKTGKRVVLVDADAHHPSLATHFQLEEAPGLTDFMANPEHNHLQVALPEQIPNMGVVPFGNAATDLSFLATPPVLEQLERLNEIADLVIICTSNLHRSDALMLATRARGVILVVTRGQSTHKALAEVVESLRLVGVKILAAVLNRPTVSVAAATTIEETNEYAPLVLAETHPQHTQPVEKSDSSEVGPSMVR